MKERYEISDAIEQLTAIVEEADVDNVLKMYQYLCNPHAVLIEKNNKFFIEVEYDD